MEPRNEKLRSPGRGSRRRSSDRHSRRSRTRSRSPYRPRNSRYSPVPGRSRSRSTCRPKFSKENESHRRSRRSPSYDNKKPRRPGFRGPEDLNYLGRESSDRRIVIVRTLETKEIPYEKSFRKRPVSDDRGRTAANGNDYPGRNSYRRSVTPRERSSSPGNSKYSSRRGSDLKNDRDYDADRRHKHDPYAKSDRRRRNGSKYRSTRSEKPYSDDEQRSRPSNRRGSKDHRQFEKYDEKIPSNKHSKDGRRADNHFSNSKQEFVKQESDIAGKSDEVEEVKMNGPSVETSDDLQHGIYPHGTMIPRFPHPLFRPMIPPLRRFPPIMIPPPRMPLGIPPGVPFVRRFPPPPQFFMQPFPRFYAATAAAPIP